MPNKPYKFERIRPQIRFIYGVILVVVMTHAPLVKFWLSLMNSNQTNDVPMQAFEGSIFIFQIPAISALSQLDLAKRMLRINHPTRILIPLFAYLFASTFWSELRGRTFWDISVITLSVLSASYLAITRESREFIWTIFVALQVPVIVSWWAIYREWDGALQGSSKYWSGIYGNRNSLAPLAAVGILAGSAIAVDALQRRRHLSSLPVIIIFCAVDTVVLKGTRSMTSVVGLGFALIMSVLQFVFSRLHDKNPPIEKKLARVFGQVLLGSVFSLTGSFLILSERVSRFFGRSAGLSGRFEFWRVSFIGIVHRPWIGWGWNSAWLSEEFHVGLPSSVTAFLWSHSVWLEFGLGGGIPALAGILIWITWSLLRTGTQIIKSKESYWVLCYVSFSVVLLSMESMSWIFHWPFALLVGTILGCESRAQNQSAEIR